jgi:co-chaperonin GroES (HSP10)
VSTSTTMELVTRWRKTAEEPGLGEPYAAYMKCARELEKSITEVLVPTESWFVIPTAGQPVEFLAMFDRVIVREDPFRSGYECKRCEGTGKLPCTECDKGKSRMNSQIQCKNCQGTMQWDCPYCLGGVKKGGLAIPDASKRRPTTGEVVSVGAECRFLKLHDKVMYTSFSGSLVDLEARERTILRILYEKEVLCRVRGHLEYRMGGEDSDFGALYPENQ